MKVYVTAATVGKRPALNLVETDGNRKTVEGISFETELERDEALVKINQKIKTAFTALNKTQS